MFMYVFNPTTLEVYFQLWDFEKCLIPNTDMYE